jgi:hypothetical protein
MVWKNEAANFTPWLADHLEYLGDVLGLELELDQREASVGRYSVDLLARDLGRGRVVVIENQLEPTDHNHLGQLITYAAGLEAGVVIWISREFREEHRQALDWLNRVHEGQTEFFGLALELLRIDDSSPAVNLKLVAFPNRWSRDAVASSEGELSPKRVAYQQFFQRFLDELREKHKFTNARAAQPQSWYSFSAGTKGFSWTFSFAAGGRVRAELYIDTPDPERNEQILDELMKERTEIERLFGSGLEWERLDDRRACRIASYRDGSIEDSADMCDEILKWGIERLLRFKEVFGPRLRSLVTVEQ